jgi:hypothetical protein
MPTMHMPFAQNLGASDEISLGRARAHTHTHVRFNSRESVL